MTQENKKLVSPYEQNIFNKIFGIDPKIRYVGFYYKGIFEGQLREGKKSHLTNIESRRSLEMAIKRWNDRKEFSKKLGRPMYTLTMYQYVKRITMEIDNEFLVLISTEIEVDHEHLLVTLIDYKDEMLEILKKHTVSPMQMIKDSKESLSFKKQTIKELQQEKIIFKELYKYLSLNKKDVKAIDAMREQIKLPSVSIKAYSEMLLDGAFGNLNAEQKEKIKEINDNIDLLIKQI